jgi:hypothetical protein
MVDIMHALHDSRKVATYARGRKWLDYALVTPRTAKTITFGGYEPFNHRFVSDHRAFSWISTKLPYLDRNHPAFRPSTNAICMPRTPKKSPSTSRRNTT